MKKRVYNITIYRNQDQAIKETFRQNYKNIQVDCDINTIREFHETFKKTCGFPDYYGMNRMAFEESFTQDTYHIHDGNDVGLNLVLTDLDLFFPESETDFHDYLRLILGCMRILNSDSIVGSSWDRYALDCRLGIVARKPQTIEKIEKVVNSLNDDEDDVNRNIRSIYDLYTTDFDIHIFGKTHKYGEYFQQVNQDYVRNNQAWPKIKITISS